VTVTRPSTKLIGSTGATQRDNSCTNASWTIACTFAVSGTIREQPDAISV
jgi:hypothetical protein